MKKILIVFTILFTSLNLYSENRDIYNEVIDSTLVSISRIIEKDLMQDNIVIPLNPWIGIGGTFILEVIFDIKNSYILALQGASESLNDKYYKQHKPFNVRKNLNFYRFRDYILEYSKLPYEIFEHLYYTYRFFLLTCIDDEMHQEIAVYGEYKFSLFENDVIEVVDKKIEILNEEDEIINKYKSSF